jgi:hypothetical protein
MIFQITIYNYESYIFFDIYDMNVVRNVL